MSDNNAYVYGHYKADTGELFYIGKGTGKRAWKRDKRNPHWQNIVDKHGYIIKILYENLSDEEAFNKEKELITEIGLENLTNITEGGEGLTSESAKLLGQRNVQNPEWRKKITESNQRKAKDPAFRKKLSESTEKYIHGEWRTKITEHNRRRAKDPSFRKQLSAAQRIKYEQDPDYRQRNKEQREKLYQNPEWRQKMKENGRKNSQNPEWRKKMKDVWKDPDLRRKRKEQAMKLVQDPCWYRKITEKNQKQAQNPEWRKKQKASRDKYKKEVTLISPVGEIVHVRGIKQFAYDNGLNASCLFGVLSGKTKSHRGWTLPGTVLPHTKKRATFISPTGKIVDVYSVSEFAKIHNLSSTRVHEVIRGVQKHHKGWTLYQPEEHKISEIV